MCGSRYEIGGSGPVDPQTLDFQHPLFRVLCRQGVTMFPVNDFSRSVRVLGIHDFEIKHTSRQNDYLLKSEEKTGNR